MAWRVFKKATAKAKERWVLSKCAKLNDRETTHGAAITSRWGGIQGGAAWKAIKDIVRGLSKVKKAKPMQLRNEDGPKCLTAEADVKRMGLCVCVWGGGLKFGRARLGPLCPTDRFLLVALRA